MKKWKKYNYLLFDFNLLSLNLIVVTPKVLRYISIVEGSVKNKEEAEWKTMFLNPLIFRRFSVYLILRMSVWVKATSISAEWIDRTCNLKHVIINFSKFWTYKTINKLKLNSTIFFIFLFLLTLKSFNELSYLKGGDFFNWTL